MACFAKQQLLMALLTLLGTLETSAVAPVSSGPLCRECLSILTRPDASPAPRKDLEQMTRDERRRELEAVRKRIEKEERRLANLRAWEGRLAESLAQPER